MPKKTLRQAFIANRITPATASASPPEIPEYAAAVVNTNAYIEQAIQAVYARDTYEQEDWLILITTDHGGHGKNHYQATAVERLTWMAINKKVDCSKYLEEGFDLK